MALVRWVQSASILLVLLVAGFSAATVSAEEHQPDDYWLIYIQNASHNIAYEEYGWFKDSSLPLSAKADEIRKFFELADATRPGFGVVSSSGKTINGRGTSFRTQVNVGDMITAMGESLEVAEVASNTSLTLTAEPSSAWNGTGYSVSSIVIRHRKPAPSSSELVFKTGKPIVRKKDNSHVLVLFPSDRGFRCTKTYESISQDSPTPTHGAKFSPSSGQPPPSPNGFICDLDSLYKGNTKITYSVFEISADKPPTEIERLKEELRVRELYRFRVTAGPVWSSLIRQNKNFQTVTNVGGNPVIISSNANDAPVNFPIFLKMYWVEHDILDKLPPISDSFCLCERAWEYIYKNFNPIVGINLVDNPFNNFYVGMSFEFFSGLDLVAGAHFSKVKQLAAGFQEGPVSTTAQPPTTEKFLPGYFVGLTVDVGVVASWIGNGIISTVKGYKN